MSPKRSIHILNPVPGGNDLTSLNRARRFVKSKRARWVVLNQEIEMLSADHRNVSAAKCASRKAASHFRDGDGFATLEQVRGIPLRPPEMAFLGKKPAEPPKEIIRTEPRVERSFLVEIPPAEAWPADLLGRYEGGRFRRMSGQEMASTTAM